MVQETFIEYDPFAIVNQGKGIPYEYVDYCLSFADSYIKLNTQLSFLCLALFVVIIIFYFKIQKEKSS